MISLNMRGRKLTYVSLFSGIEAVSLALDPDYWEPLAFAEIEPFPCAVLRARFPQVPNLGDVSKVDWKEMLDGWGAVDAVWGGSPCQSFSVAGKREGLDGASGLMWEYVRCVRELSPRWVVWENVPGCLSSGKPRGSDFACLLDALDECGYEPCWRVMDSQFLGVAQRRRRVFLVAHLGDGRSAEVLFERESLRGDNPTSREKREALAAAARGGSEAASAGFKFHQGSGAGGVGYGEELSPTLTSDWHQPAVLTPWDVQTMHQNADGDVHVTDDMTGSITAQSSVSRQQIVCMSSGQANADGSAYMPPRGTSPTLLSGTNEGANIQPIVATNVYQFNGHIIGRKPENGGNSVEPENPYENGVYTLTALHAPSGRNEHFIAMTDTQPNTLVTDAGGAIGSLTHRMYKDPPLLAGMNRGTFDPPKECL